MNVLKEAHRRSLTRWRPFTVTLPSSACLTISALANTDDAQLLGEIFGAVAPLRREVLLDLRDMYVRAAHKTTEILRELTY
jgi:hypothetical protein